MTDRPIALVAGATGTLGQPIVLALAAKGFEVICGYHKNADLAIQLAKEIAGQAAFISSDQTREELEAKMEKWRKLAVVVNATGVNHEGAALSLDEADWALVYEVNFAFALKLSRAAIRLMLLSGGGRLIHLSSAAARLGGRGQLNYAVAKAALERLTRGLAMEVGPKGILINAVAPGIIVSPMAQRVISKYPEELLARIASRRFGQPKDVAEVVAFLAGPEASYINGAIIPVDGGLW